MQLKDLLKNEGYLTVALPSADIQAQQILVKDSAGTLKRLPDKVFQLFKQADGVALPTTSLNAAVANMSGSVVTAADASLAAGFLNGLLQKMGVSFNFAVSANSDDQLVCMFESPLKDEISSFVDLDTFLNGAILNEGTYGEMLKNNDIYIITSVLKSSNFAVGLVNSDKLSAALVMPSIKDFVEGTVTASKNSDVKRVVAYKGEQALVFGLRAVQVIFDRTAWQALTGQKGHFHIEDTSGVTVKDIDDVKVKYLEGENVMLWE